jgi:hypothetical protein
MEDGCLSASEIMAWRNLARLTRYAGGYRGIALIMANTPKVGGGPTAATRYGSAG